MSVKIIFVYTITFLKQMFISKSRILSHSILLVTSLIFPVAVWYSFIEDTTLMKAYVRSIIINYIFFSVFTYWHYEYISGMIRMGRLNLLLLYPQHILKTFFFRFCGNVLSKAIVCIPAIIVLFVLREKTFVATNVLSIAVNIVFYMLLLLIAYFIGIIFGSFSFWIGEIWPLRFFLNISAGALAGTWFPFIGKLQMMSYLPFGLLGGGGASFISADSGSRNMYLLSAAFWMAILCPLALLLWKRGSARYEANGG